MADDTASADVAGGEGVVDLTPRSAGISRAQREGPAPSIGVGGVGAARGGTLGELVHAIGRVMDALTEQRTIILEGERERIEVEIQNARLRADLEIESELRRRAEHELRRMRAAIEDRKSTLLQDIEQFAEVELHEAPGSDPEESDGEAAPPTGAAHLGAPESAPLELGQLPPGWRYPLEGSSERRLSPRRA